MYKNQDPHFSQGCTRIRIHIFLLHRFLVNNIDTIEKPKKVFIVSVIYSAKSANFVSMAFNLVNTVARTRNPYTGNKVEFDSCVSTALPP